MRTYLSSYRFGRRASALTYAGGRALIVMNALDEYERRMLSWDREVNDLAQLGYRSEELDLRDYWRSPAGPLHRRLDNVDLIWVVGGNAFVLARAATEAGLAAALTESSNLTYAGYSAGACLTSIDLRGIDRMDDQNSCPPAYSMDMPAHTLRLTSTRVVPHAGSEEADVAAAHLRMRKLEFFELADGEDVFLDT